jgi:hypothetical protein
VRGSSGRPEAGSEDAPDAEEVAARFVVEVVAERTLATVLEEDADEARSAGYDGRHHLHDLALSPSSVGAVKDAVSDTKIEPFVHGASSPLPVTRARIPLYHDAAAPRKLSNGAR